MSPSIAGPVSRKQLSSLLQQLQPSQVPDTFEGRLDEASRKQMLAAAKKLVAALEQPTDVVMHYA